MRAANKDQSVFNMLKSEHGLLIGRWPMVVCSQVYGLIYSLRTNAIDVPLVNTARKVDGIPLPDLLS